MDIKNLILTTPTHTMVLYTFLLIMLAVVGFANALNPLIRLEQAFTAWLCMHFWKIFAFGLVCPLLSVCIGCCTEVNLRTRIRLALIRKLTAAENRLERLMGIKITAQAGMMLSFAPLFEIFFLALTAINWRSLLEHLPRNWMLLSFVTVHTVSILSFVMFGSLMLGSLDELAERIWHSSPRQLDSFNFNTLSSCLAIFSPMFIAAIVGRVGILDILYPMILLGMVGLTMLSHVFARLALAQDVAPAKVATVSVPARKPVFPSRPDHMDPAEYDCLRRLDLVPGYPAAKKAWSEIKGWREQVDNLGYRIEKCLRIIGDYKRRLATAEARMEVKQRSLTEMTKSRDEWIEIAESLQRERDVAVAEREAHEASRIALQNTLAERDTQIRNQTTAAGVLYAKTEEQAKVIADLQRKIDHDMKCELQLAIDTERHQAELNEIDAKRAKENAEAEYLEAAYRQQAEWAEEEHGKTKENLRRVKLYAQRLQDELRAADTNTAEQQEQLGMKGRTIKALTQMVTKSNNERDLARSLKEKLDTADKNAGEYREQLDMRARTIRTLGEKTKHLENEQDRKVSEHRHELNVKGITIRRLLGQIKDLENERDGIELVLPGEIEDWETPDLAKGAWIEACKGGDCHILDCFCKRLVVEE